MNVRCLPTAHSWGAWFYLTGGSPAYVTSYAQMHACTACGARQFRSVDSIGRALDIGRIHPPADRSCWEWPAS